ncbi:MAG: biotin/lipoyl-binding protein [Bryobacteraceae bacterium]
MHSIRRATRRAVPLVIWVLAAGAAYWLHRQSAGAGQASGMAEVREFNVSALETGRLESVEVAVGQRVSRGQVLARLDSGTLEREVAVAEAQLRELEAMVPAEDRALQLSGLQTERAFQSEVEDAQVAVQSAQAAYERDRAELEGLREEIARQRDLVARRLADARRLAELEAQVAPLAESVAAWPGRIDGLSRREEAARERLAEWRLRHAGATGGDARREQVRPLELRVSRQLDQLALLRKRLSAFQLTSPVDARVTAILARPGAVLTPGSPALALVEEARHVTAYVEEDRGYNVAVGDVAEIRPRTNHGERVYGTVTSVAAFVSEIPARFWPSPNRPRWGRQIFVQLDPASALDPGQAVDLSFLSKNEAWVFGRRVAARGAGPTGAGRLKPLIVPPALLHRSRFEPSGIVWVGALDRYLAVSDDTGQEEENDNAPWLFAITRDGIVEPQPIPIRGVDAVNDLEAITAAPDGTIYVIASQSENRKGRRRPARTIFIQAQLDGGALVAVNHVFFYDLLARSGRSDPGFLASLGLERDPRGGGPLLEIEGLAWQDGALLIGLKAPLDPSGRAQIWRLGRPERLLAGSLRDAQLSLWGKVSLPVGGRPAGISELLSLGDGSLLVAATNEAGGSLFRVTASKQVMGAAPLAPFPGLKPEGLCRSAGGELVTVIFDRQQDTPLWTHLEVSR